MGQRESGGNSSNSRVIFLVGVVELVIWNDGFAQLSVNRTTIVVNATLCVLGNKVIEAHVLQVIRPMRIEGVYYTILKYLSGLWISVLHFSELRVVD